MLQIVYALVFVLKPKAAVDKGKTTRYKQIK